MADKITQNLKALRDCRIGVLQTNFFCSIYHIFLKMIWTTAAF